MRHLNVNGKAPAPASDHADGTAIRQHYADVVLPAWRTVGFDRRLGLPHESLQWQSPEVGVTPIASTRYRAMACARQLFVFSEAGDRAHADHLFASLVDYFQDEEQGGFIFSVDSSGKPLDTSKDLYTHAFVIFACAAYLRRFGVTAAGQVARNTATVIDASFPVDPDHGLPAALASRDFRESHVGARQNPLMHLAEAYLMASGAGAGALFDTALATLLEGVSRTFSDPRSRCILELPRDMAENRIEPGHQFEWFYLAYGSNHPAFRHTGMNEALAAAFAFAQNHGVETETGGVLAALTLEGTVIDASQRIWAQTEYLRALACHPDAAQRNRLAAQIERFRSRFLHPHGWHESLTSQQGMGRTDMPSTTPYHLQGAYAALP
ncbi:MAG: AGE family epimerase/isomerase [Janthinobacterium lividum]